MRCVSGCGEISNGDQMTELYRPVLNKELLKQYKKPIVESLLYDLDLLPEQLAAQKNLTLELFAAYNRLEGVLLAFAAMEIIMQNEITVKIAELEVLSSDWSKSGTGPDSWARGDIYIKALLRAFPGFAASYRVMEAERDAALAREAKLRAELEWQLDAIDQGFLVARDGGWRKCTECDAGADTIEAIQHSEACCSGRIRAALAFTVGSTNPFPGQPIGVADTSGTDQPGTASGPERA